MTKCEKCGKESGVVIPTERDRELPYEFWCLACVVREAMKPYGSVTNFLAAEGVVGK